MTGAMEALVSSRENFLSNSWTEEPLTSWQIYASRIQNVRNEPFLLLFFHDDNIEYIIEETRKRVQQGSGMPAPKPEKKQLVITLTLVYDNLKEESRDNLEELLIRANRRVVETLVKKMLTNASFYTKFYNEKVAVPQPLPFEFPKNVNKGGTRTLSGGKPFVI